MERGGALTVMTKFKLALRKTYEEDPCVVLPNALWKTLGGLNDLYYSSNDSTSSEVLALRAWDENGLHVFWNRDRTIDESLYRMVTRYSFLIIHDDYYNQIDTREFRLIKPFFRIKHDHQNMFSYALTKDFYVREADVETEFQAMSDLIGKCYKDLRPSLDVVRSWTAHPVFDKSLWLWIMDKSKNAPAALGIAEVDRSVPEGSLEWIQVLPEYQGKGLGKALVLELLHRLRGKANFTTVSGEVDSQTNPERLYRSCGFAGNDVWWLLRK